MKRSLLPAVVLSVLISPAMAQERNGVYVNSWQRGAETVADQTIRITLGPAQSDYVTDVTGNAGKRFRLKVIHTPLADVKMEHWQVELREILTPPGMGQEILGPNLLMAEGPGPGKHNFPPEDFVGYFYPHENPPVVIIGGRPFIESHFFYPVMTPRRIRVEGFYVTLRVEDFRRSGSDKNKLDFLDLSIEFRDGSPQKTSAKLKRK